MAPSLEQRYRGNAQQPPSGESPRPAASDARATKPGYRLASQVLGIVAMMTLSFLVEQTVLGGLRHDHDQAELAAQFRIQLALSTAAVGPVDDAGRPLASGTPVAVLEIPRLGLWEVVVEGTSSGTLMSGPGHRRDSPLPGQAGTSLIAGRRSTYGGPFRSIDQLRAGDRFTVTTGQGKHMFAVLGVRRAGDPVPPALSRGHGRLTLLTTDGPALSPRDVLRVDADLVSEVQPRAAQLPTGALPAADAALAGDNSDLWGLVGWLVLLVAAAAGLVWVRHRLGWWRTWVIGLPVLVVLGLTVADEIAVLLPNLL